MDWARRRFIQGLAPAGVAAALPGRLRASAFAVEEKKGRVPPSGGPERAPLPEKGFVMTRQELERKALRIQALLEDKTLQVHGLVPMFVRASDYRLPTAESHPGTYFAVPLRPRYRLWGPDWQPGTKPWSIGIIYVTLMFHAWRVGGDPEYLRQIERWYAGCGLDNPPSGGMGGTLARVLVSSNGTFAGTASSGVGQHQGESGYHYRAGGLWGFAYRSLRVGEDYCE